MAKWIIDVQGYREILDADGEPVQRRKTLQVIGATVTDDGAVTVIEVPPGAVGATGATGATGAALLSLASSALRDDFHSVYPGLTADGEFWGDIGPWMFQVIGGTASINQRTTLDTNHPGAVSFSTGPTSGEWAISYGDSSRHVLWSHFKKLTVVWRTSNVFALSVASIGISTLANQPNTSATAAFFHSDPATSANWRARTRDGSAQTADVDTGIAITGGTWRVLEIERDPSTDALTFKINGVTGALIPAATHLIDAADEFKIAVYYDNNNAAVAIPNVDLIVYETIDTLDRTTGS